jgi:hypothetical protein
LICCLYEQLGGSDGVAAGVPAGGGDVGGAGQAVTADGEVAQAGHEGCPFPVRIWEWSSAKVTSRIQCSLFSMDQGLDDRGELVGADVTEAEVGDGVDGLGMPAVAGGARVGFGWRWRVIWAASRACGNAIPLSMAVSLKGA